MVILMVMCQSFFNFVIFYQVYYYILQFLVLDKIGLMRLDNDELIRNIGLFFLFNILKYMYLG